MNDISYLGKTAGRPPRKVFGIKGGDRAFHVHVIGKTGSGKTNLLEAIIRQDIAAGRGVALVDPHGDLAERIHQFARTCGRMDVVYLDAGDPRTPYGYNPLRRVGQAYIPLAVSGFMEVLKKHFKDAWGTRIEHILRNALFAIYETGGGTLFDIVRLVTEKNFRKDLAAKVNNPVIKHFWEVEFPANSRGYQNEAVASLSSKINAFLADPRMRRIVAEPPVNLSLRQVMDEGQVLIVNLSRGRVGEDSASLLGALLVTSIGLAAYTRANLPVSQRRMFYLFIDEFHTYTTRAVAEMLSELRKFKLSAVVAHQHLHQLEEEVKHSVVGNAGTLIVFRVGGIDSELLSKELSGVFSPTDLVSLPNFEMAIRLMIDGEPCRPFTATTLPV